MHNRRKRGPIMSIVGDLRPNSRALRRSMSPRTIRTAKQTKKYVKLQCYFQKQQELLLQKRGNKNTSSKMQFLCRDSWGKKSKRWHCAYRKLFRGSDQSTPDKKVDKRTSPFYCKAVRFHAYFQSNSGLFALPNSNYKELNGTKIENPHLFHKLELHVSRS